MTCDDVRILLDDVVDGTLSAGERLTVELHLAECRECREQLEFLRGLLVRTAKLPDIIPPSRNLWKDISTRLDESASDVAEMELHKRRNGKGEPDRESISSHNSIQRLKRMSTRTKVFAMAACLVFVTGSMWFVSRLNAPSWTVERLDGVLKIGSENIANAGKLRVGEWLETDNTSRAKIDVGLIGEVEVEPNSRLRLIEAQATDHRVELEKGTIHARIWAPPRLFFVETSSATAIDLGCAYTLTVAENGAGLLKVSAGYVALNHDAKESIVPAGSACETRPGIGPGTPFKLSAKEDFRRALSDFDFEQGGTAALTSVLSSARKEDGVTLWHLLSQARGKEKELVLDKFESLAGLPAGVTREGILQNKKGMMELLAEEVGISL